MLLFDTRIALILFLIQAFWRTIWRNTDSDRIVRSDASKIELDNYADNRNVIIQTLKLNSKCARFVTKLWFGQ